VRCPNPDWIFNRLTVSGPVDQLQAFRRAARGCGAVPWILDYDHIEEDLFALLLRPPPEQREIGIEGARSIARETRQLVREATELVHDVAETSRACPFDLHRLIPVPWQILRLGPDDPDSVSWMWRHWGTTRTLRRVEEFALGRPRSQPALHEAATEFWFWSADWSPWPAIEALRLRWPALRLDVSPDPGRETGVASGRQEQSLLGSPTRRTRAAKIGDPANRGADPVCPSGRTRPSPSRPALRT